MKTSVITARRRREPGYPSKCIQPAMCNGALPVDTWTAPAYIHRNAPDPPSQLTRRCPMRTLRWTPTVLFVAGFALLPFAQAQSPLSSILGNVTDQTHSPVPSALV